MKRTKIVCTVGPGTDKFGILEDMMRAGMNVARFTSLMVRMKSKRSACKWCVMRR